MPTLWHELTFLYTIEQGGRGVSHLMERSNNDFTAAIDLSISLAVFPTCSLLPLPSFPQLNPTAAGQIPAAPVLSDRVRSPLTMRDPRIKSNNANYLSFFSNLLRARMVPALRFIVAIGRFVTRRRRRRRQGEKRKGAPLPLLSLQTLAK